MLTRNPHVGACPPGWEEGSRGPRALEESDAVPGQDSRTNQWDSRLRGGGSPVQVGLPLMILNVPLLTLGDGRHLPESPGPERAFALRKALPARKHFL